MTDSKRGLSLYFGAGFDLRPFDLFPPEEVKDFVSMDARPKFSDTYWPLISKYYEEIVDNVHKKRGWVKDLEKSKGGKLLFYTKGDLTHQYHLSVKLTANSKWPGKRPIDRLYIAGYHPPFEFIQRLPLISKEKSVVVCTDTIWDESDDKQTRFPLPAQMAKAGFKVTIDEDAPAEWDSPEDPLYDNPSNEAHIRAFLQL